MEAQDKILLDIDNFSVASSYIGNTIKCNDLVSNSEKSLNIITQNIRSVYKNLDSFIAHISQLSFEPDLIILTESRLDVNKPVPGLLGYKCHFSKKLLNQNDGLTIYSKHTIDCIITEPEPQGANFLVIKIKPDIVILAIYRSPSFYHIDNFLDSLGKIIQHINSKNIFMIGDMNIDIKTCNIDRNSSSYLDLTSSLGFLPGHTYPTRQGNCLDHVMVKSVLSTKIIVMDSTVTDHGSILVNLTLDSPRKTEKNYIDKIDYKNAIRSIESSDFSFISETCNPETAANRFVDILSSAKVTNTKKVHLPRSKRTLKPWLTPGLLKCIRHRDKLHQKLKKDPNNEILNISYKRYRNFCNSLLNKLKRQHEKVLLKSAKNPKETWAAINSISGRKNKSNFAKELLKENPLDSVEKVNQYFANIGRVLADRITNRKGQHVRNSTSNQLLNSFVLISPDEAEVESVLLGLKNNCAIGWDCIPAVFLKMIKDVAEKGISSVVEWLDENLLTLNISKSTFLQFRITNTRDLVDINLRVHSCDQGQTQCSCLGITKSNSVRYLGVLLDDKLKWLPHIELMSSRLRVLIWTFKNLRHAR
ncbi:hypothetical protein ACJJTC_006561 [Scirpophaga incertulas]